MREFRDAGLPGSPGSMDACHVVMEKCSHRLKQNHLGGKSKLTCRSFNLTSDHRKRILHTTLGHPVRWNDKTIVLFDEFATKLRNGEIMNDNFFELLKENPNGEVVAIKYCVAWIIVDNGYLDWSVTIPPMKETMFIRSPDGQNGWNP